MGQLLMVGVSTSGLDSATSDAIRLSNAGSVVLLGKAEASRADISVVNAAVGALGTAELPILVAVDQEGGQVQRLQGEGFSRIPSAVEQGALAPEDLHERAASWGQELRDAGVRFNLAPTADVVPAEGVSKNAPIGRLQRHYGTAPEAVSGSAVAFIEGMQDAGIATSVKHFPGLGRVKDNTDFAVARDTVTVEDDAYWMPFIDGIAAGASSVMVSSAVFEKIDPDSEAVFSKKIITDILRGKLAFDGVVIADDLGAAKSVADIEPGERAVRFVTAGGDLVITADPKLATDMSAALVEAAEDPAFEEQVTASTARVLALKESVGELACE